MFPFDLSPRYGAGNIRCKDSPARGFSGENSPRRGALGDNSGVLETFTCPTASLTIDTVGGRVHSYANAAGELLYASPHPSKDSHAGIPLCAPWFGSGQIGSTHPSTHGLIKWVDWQIISRDIGDTIDLVLEPNHEQISALDGYAGYEGLTYRLDVHAGDTLTLALAITATHPTTVDAAFHTYLRAQVPGTVTIAPALERDYVNNVEHNFAGERRIDGAHDSVFLGGACQPVQIDTGMCQLVITSNQPDVVVWNPGPEDRRFTGDQWKEFFCVETGAVQDHAVTIEAGHTWVMEMSLAVTPS